MSILTAVMINSSAGWALWNIIMSRLQECDTLPCIDPSSTLVEDVLLARPVWAILVSFSGSP
jgi:hypothetical protein